MAQLFFFGNRWFDHPPKLTGPMDHAFWMGSAVFDGARAFHGLAPDLDRHCARVVASAVKLLLRPKLNAEEVTGICRQALRKLPLDDVYYVKPMFYPLEGLVVPESESTEFVLGVHTLPFPEPPTFSACRSSFRRPATDMAPTDAKACCLYPNISRMLTEAAGKGFDNAVVVDPEGFVAEFSNANLWLVKDGKVTTPELNGTFLNGITRQRVLALLRDDGMDVREAKVSFEEVYGADELFNSGNLGKVMPCTRIEDRQLPCGPVYERARELYFKFAETQPI